MPHFEGDIVKKSLYIRQKDCKCPITSPIILLIEGRRSGTDPTYVDDISLNQKSSEFIKAGKNSNAFQTFIERNYTSTNSTALTTFNQRKMFAFQGARSSKKSGLILLFSQTIQSIPSIPKISPNTLTSSQIIPKRYAKSLIYVTGFPKDMTRSEIESFFRMNTAYVKLARILKDVTTGRSIGMARVLYYRRSAASRCVEKLNGTYIAPGHKLIISRGFTDLMDKKKHGDYSKYKFLTPMRRDLLLAQARPDEAQLVPSKTLYVGNIPFRFTKYDIRAKFEEFGPIQQIIKGPNAKGFAHVVFQNLDDANFALQRLDGREWGGRNMYVKYAYDKNELEDVDYKRSTKPVDIIEPRKLLKNSPVYRDLDANKNTEAYAKIKKRAQKGRLLGSRRGNIVAPGPTLRLPGVKSYSPKGAMKASHTHHLRNSEAPLNDNELMQKLGLALD